MPRGDWNTAWVVGTLGAFVLYGVGAWMAYAGWLRLRLALVAAVAIQVVPLAAPLLLSKDVFLYWGEARIVTVHHANPYRSTPADYPTDPACNHVSESWRAEPTPYGPVWVAFGAIPAVAAGSSAHRAELAYRLLAALALLAAIALVALRTRNAAAVAFLGWSPLLALHFGGGGHSDALMMVVVLAAVAAGTRGTGGALWPSPRRSSPSHRSSSRSSWRSAAWTPARAGGSGSHPPPLSSPPLRLHSSARPGSMPRPRARISPRRSAACTG